MIQLIDTVFDLDTASQAIGELNAFLADHQEIEETGAAGLQQFFCARPSLLLLAGECFGPPSFLASAYAPEFSVFREFRADFAIANKERDKFLFVEFEAAKRDSVFSVKHSGKSSVSYEWAKPFEHGYSQLVDWHYLMDDMERTSRFQEHFGVDRVSYDGLLVIGRDSFVNEAGCYRRLRWRKDKTVVNSRRLHCLTFDALANEIQGRYETYAMRDASNRSLAEVIDDPSQ